MDEHADAVMNYVLADILSRPELEEISISVNVDMTGISEDLKESKRAEEIEDLRVYFRRFAARHYRLDVHITDRVTGNTIFECKGAPTFLERLALIYNRPVSEIEAEVNPDFVKKFGIEIAPEIDPAWVLNDEEEEQVDEVLSPKENNLKRQAEDDDEKDPKKIRYLNNKAANKEFLKNFNRKPDTPIPEKTLEEREQAITKMLAKQMKEKKRQIALAAAAQKCEKKKRDREFDELRAERTQQKKIESSVIVLQESPHEPPSFVIAKKTPKKESPPFLMSKKVQKKESPLKPPSLLIAKKTPKKKRQISMEPSTSKGRSRTESKSNKEHKAVSSLEDQTKFYDNFYKTPSWSQQSLKPIKKKSALEELSDEEKADRAGQKRKKVDPDIWSDDECIRPSPVKLRGKIEKEDPFKVLKEARAKRADKYQHTLPLTKNEWRSDENEPKQQSPDLFPDSNDTIDQMANECQEIMQPHFGDELDENTFESHTHGVYFKDP